MLQISVIPRNPPQVNLQAPLSMPAVLFLELDKAIDADYMVHIR